MSAVAGYKCRQLSAHTDYIQPIVFNQYKKQYTPAEAEVYCGMYVVSNRQATRNTHVKEYIRMISICQAFQVLDSHSVDLLDQILSVQAHHLEEYARCVPRHTVMEGFPHHCTPDCIKVLDYKVPFRQFEDNFV